MGPIKFWNLLEDKYQKGIKIIPESKNYQKCQKAILSLFGLKNI